MEPFTTLLQVLGEASGWVIAVALAITFAYGFYKGWWIPGFVYQREVKRADDNDKTLEAATASLATSADATKESAKANAELARRFNALQRKLDRSGASDEPL